MKEEPVEEVPAEKEPSVKDEPVGKVPVEKEPSVKEEEPVE